MFQKAIKSDAKARVALIGPSGSGKSYTMLVLARELAGPHGKIAAIDTEHGSLKLYAHTKRCPPNCADPSHFDFDVVEMTSYSPDNWMKARESAERQGYNVFCTDSLSHFWVGKDGALEFVDAAQKRNNTGHGQEGWKAFRPHERAMVDSMIASPCHIICTMRTKTEYADVEEKGKKKRVKIGLAPVQRDGLEYEMTIVAYMDDDNNLIIDKTRCFPYAGKVQYKPKGEWFRPFIDWLAEDAPEAPAVPAAPAPQPQQQQPQPAPAAAVPPPPDTPEEVLSIWAAMLGPDGKPKKSLIIGVLDGLGKDIEELTGSTGEFFKVLGEFDMNKPADCVLPIVGFARTKEAARKLWEFINSCHKANESPEITDDEPAIAEDEPVQQIQTETTAATDQPTGNGVTDADIPVELGGTWTEPPQPLTRASFTPQETNSLLVKLVSARMISKPAEFDRFLSAWEGTKAELLDQVNNRYIEATKAA